MNKNQKTSKIYFLMILVSGTLALQIAANSPIYSQDIFWHVKTGEDFLFEGANPLVDHYSISHQGKPIKHATVLFDAFIAIFVKTFGLKNGILQSRFFFWLLPF